MKDRKASIGVLGCGWLGLPLASSLEEKGLVVNGSVRTIAKNEILQSKNINPFIVDIDQDELIDVDFLSVEILVIAVPCKKYLSFQNLISKIEKSSIKKVIFISATSVYPSSESLITEEHKTLDTPLASIEKLFLNHSGFQTTILRFGGLIGGNRNPGNFFKKGRIIKNPEGVVNMIHQEDCIEIIFKVIENGIETEIFNACADSHPTRRDFYTKVKTELGFEMPVFEETMPVQMKIISSDKLKSKLSYTFKYSDLLSL